MTHLNILIRISLCIFICNTLAYATPVKIILDTDMSGDADDVGTLAMLNALYDINECEIIAIAVNRKDKTNASAAAVDAINTWYGRPKIPIGTDKKPPANLQRTSLYTCGLRDGFPNDIGPDDKAPDALKIYKEALKSQPDKSVIICSVGSLSNLADLCRDSPELVKAKVIKIVIMGGNFSSIKRSECNIQTNPKPAAFVAASCPVDIYWQDFHIGNKVITGAGLKQSPKENPVRRGYELRYFGKRPSIEGGQPSYDQCAALFAVRGADQKLWSIGKRGCVTIDAKGYTSWKEDSNGNDFIVHRKCKPNELAQIIEALMVQPPQTQFKE
jgi:inosine-uridine nucleoside N-ribohydrolase